ncbi:hypothetical protein [Skermanella pratensis]|uniref:hypothetical protein n=1 Tax=Skermanella pratensis TaxID=2233999 RepID=UPI00130158EC|nr:hypothetical protein [Skermanella pratensis]
MRQPIRSAWARLAQAVPWKPAGRPSSSAASGNRARQNGGSARGPSRTRIRRRRNGIHRRRSISDQRGCRPSQGRWTLHQTVSSGSSWGFSVRQRHAG